MADIKILCQLYKRLLEESVKAHEWLLLFHDDFKWLDNLTYTQLVM